MALTADQLKKHIDGNALKIVMADIKGRIDAVSAGAAVYTIAPAAAPDSGYSATYEFKKDGVTQSKINLALDYFCKAVSAVRTAAAGDDAVTTGGIAVGHKYVDFTVGAASGGADQHLYLDVADLVDVYTSGNGVYIDSNNEVSAKVATTGGNGLSADADGLKLATATATDAGAMSAADKAKLDGIAVMDATDATALIADVFGAAA